MPDLEGVDVKVLLNDAGGAAGPRPQGDDVIEPILDLAGAVQVPFRAALDTSAQKSTERVAQRESARLNETGVGSSAPSVKNLQLSYRKSDKSCGQLRPSGSRSPCGSTALAGTGGMPALPALPSRRSRLQRLKNAASSLRQSARLSPASMLGVGFDHSYLVLGGYGDDGASASRGAMSIEETNDLACFRRYQSTDRGGAATESRLAIQLDFGLQQLTENKAPS